MMMYAEFEIVYEKSSPSPTKNSWRNETLSINFLPGIVNVCLRTVGYEY